MMNDYGLGRRLSWLFYHVMSLLSPSPTEINYKVHTRYSIDKKTYTAALASSDRKLSFSLFCGGYRLQYRLGDLLI
jgi:hypothetical protein